MSEPQTLIIDGQSYDAESVDQQCREMLVAVQTGNQAVALASALIEVAKVGIDSTFFNAKKLLPEPLAVEGEVEDEEPTH
jgi:hypothetical protein